MDLQESGRKIGEKLFALLSSNQKKELAQFVRDYETGNIPADVSYTPLFRGQYFIPPQADQPLTEIREGDLYFCLEQHLVTVRGQVIPLTVKEFEIFALLINLLPPVKAWPESLINQAPKRLSCRHIIPCDGESGACAFYPRPVWPRSDRRQSNTPGW